MIFSTTEYYEGPFLIFAATFFFSYFWTVSRRVEGTPQNAPFRLGRASTDDTSDSRSPAQLVAVGAAGVLETRSVSSDRRGTGAERSPSPVIARKRPTPSRGMKLAGDAW